MKRSRLLLIASASLLPALAMAQSPFDGTWKVNLNKVQLSHKAVNIAIKNGVYRCMTCMPPITVKADGSDQPVKGHFYYDTMSIKIVDDHTVLETDKKNGTVVATATTTVSPDDKTATIIFTDSSNTNAAPIHGKATLARIAPAPAGSHAFSGSWRNESIESLSDNALLMTFKVDGDRLSMTTQTGQSYNAKMDGTESPYKGDPGIDSVKVTKNGSNSFVETDLRQGKPISVATIDVAPDGKTLNVHYQDTLRHTATSFVAEKQ
jgi:hypothetical protein